MDDTPEFIKIRKLHEERVELPQRYTRLDVESSPGSSYLYNDTVTSFAWQNVSVSLRGTSNGPSRHLIKGLSGNAQAGELVAIMGPSGSGKSTLLDALANRPALAKATVEKSVYINQHLVEADALRHTTRYIEQHDYLIGSLTARETLDFAAKLSLHGYLSRAERQDRVNRLLDAFGLRGQANTIVGTPIRKGLSGGQKRRLSVASQLITSPKVLILDEPTSGLDSVASFEMMNYLREIARQSRIIVIASIHQPSASTFNLFDRVFLLASGQLCYGGSRERIPTYFESIGYAIPAYMNVPEYLLSLVNADFATQSGSAASATVQHLSSLNVETKPLPLAPAYHLDSMMVGKGTSPGGQAFWATQMRVPIILLHRSFIKSYRDVTAYGIRIAMYLGLAIMMGTVWLRLQTTQDYIQPFINAIFFGSAFMSFMAVAYVPAFLEDRAIFMKERANGLYGASSFLIANFMIGIPYLFLISLLFSIISYWLCNFRPDGTAFMTWIMWIFLDLLAAESLVVLVSSIFPVFVVALALTAFANGLWMSVGGFLVSPTVLNVFWKYWARYIDYQSYVFQGMMVNEFSQRSYACAVESDGETCRCMYPPSSDDPCSIPGQSVLDSYGYVPGWQSLWVGILLCIVLGYRLLAFGVLCWKRT